MGKQKAEMLKTEISKLKFEIIQQSLEIRGQNGKKKQKSDGHGFS
jgi:hypothetical protein